MTIDGAYSSRSVPYLGEGVLEVARPVAQRPDVDAQVVVLRGRRDAERVPTQAVPSQCEKSIVSIICVSFGFFSVNVSPEQFW